MILEQAFFRFYFSSRTKLYIFASSFLVVSFNSFIFTVTIFDQNELLIRQLLSHQNLLLPLDH